MLSHCQLRIGVLLLLFAIPYLCDVVSADELKANLFIEQATVLEADLDDEKATGTVSAIGLVVISNASSVFSVFLGVTIPALYYQSQSSLAVFGCRPPPPSL